MLKKLVATFAFCLILPFALIVSVNATKSDKLSMKEMSLLVGGDNPPNNCQQTSWEYGGGDCYYTHTYQLKAEPLERTSERNSEFGFRISELPHA